MNFFKPRQEKERTKHVPTLQKKAENYLNKYYTQTKLRSIIEKSKLHEPKKIYNLTQKNPKFYMLEPDSINGIAQVKCNGQEKLLTKSHNLYKLYPDDNSPIDGCRVDIEYNKMNGTIEKTDRDMYFDENRYLWNRNGNGYISNESARTVTLGGKRKTRRRIRRKSKRL